MQSPPIPRYLVPPRYKYSPQHHVLKHPQLPFLPQCQRPSFTPIQRKSVLRTVNISFYARSVPNIKWRSVCPLDNGYLIHIVSRVAKNCVEIDVIWVNHAIYERESIGNPKISIKIRTTSRFTCKFQQWYWWFEEWLTGGSAMLHRKIK